MDHWMLNEHGDPIAVDALTWARGGAMTEDVPAHDAGEPNRYRMEARVLRNGRVIRTDPDWMPEVTTQEGVVCSHAAHESGGFTSPSCRWCQSQGRDGTYRPVMVVECPRCGGIVAEDELVNHWLRGCWG